MFHVAAPRSGNRDHASAKAPERPGPALKAMNNRRFPAPWSAELTPNCFIVRDADGQQLGYVYYESEPGRRSAAKLFTRVSSRIFSPSLREPSSSDKPIAVSNRW
jgi:hypothetical protein